MSSAGSTQKANWKAVRHSLNDPVNRLYRLRISEWIADRLCKTFVTPNMVSVSHMLVGIGAAALVAKGWIVVGVVLYELRNILDCLDGDLARAQKSSSKVGVILDMVGDTASFITLCAAILYQITIQNPEIPILNASLIVLGAAVTVMICALLWDWRRAMVTKISDGKVDTPLKTLAETNPAKTKKIMQFLGFTSGDSCLNVILVFLVLNHPLYAVYAVLIYGWIVILAGLPFSHKVFRKI